MSEELKPCPFCGGIPAISGHRDLNSWWRYRCLCGGCGASVETIDQSPDWCCNSVVKRWNTRVDSAAQKRIAELEDREAKGQVIYQNAVANNEHFARENLRLVNERDAAEAKLRAK